MTALTPTSGSYGASVGVTGTNFDAASVVYFNGQQASTTYYSATSLQAFVPVGATTGPVTITERGSLLQSTGTPPRFVVTLGTAVSPTTASPGTSVQIVGTGFNAHEPVGVALDNGAPTTIATDGTGNLIGTVALPATLGSGPHTITSTGANSHLATQSTVYASVDIPQTYVGPAANESDPLEVALSPSTAANLAPSWSATDGSATAGNQSMVELGGLLFVADGSTLMALNASSGTQAWSVTLPNPSVSLAADNGLVFVGTGGTTAKSGAVTAYAATTGTQTWTTAASCCDAVNNLTVANGQVLVGNYSRSSAGVNGVVALFEGSGVRHWQTTGSGDIDSNVAVADGYGYALSNIALGGGKHSVDLQKIDLSSGALAATRDVSYDAPTPSGADNGATDTFSSGAVSTAGGAVYLNLVANVLDTGHYPSYSLPLSYGQASLGLQALATPYYNDTALATPFALTSSHLYTAADSAPVSYTSALGGRAAGPASTGTRSIDGSTGAIITGSDSSGLIWAPRALGVDGFSSSGAPDPHAGCVDAFTRDLATEVVEVCGTSATSATQPVLIANGQVILLTADHRVTAFAPSSSPR